MSDYSGVKEQRKTSNRSLDVFVVLLCLAGAAACLYLFYDDLYVSFRSPSEEQAGIVVIRQNIVHRRLNDRLVWDRLFTDTPVYNGDVIRVARLSGADLNIDESRIGLGENTLIRIQKDSDLLKIHFYLGDVKIASNSKGTPVLLSLGESVVEAAPGTVLNVSANNDGAVMRITEGKAYIIQEGKVSPALTASPGNEVIIMQEKAGSRLEPVSAQEAQRRQEEVKIKRQDLQEEIQRERQWEALTQFPLQNTTQFSPQAVTQFAAQLLPQIAALPAKIAALPAQIAAQFAAPSAEQLPAPSEAQLVTQLPAQNTTHEPDLAPEAALQLAPAFVIHEDPPPAPIPPVSAPAPAREDSREAAPVALAPSPALAPPPPPPALKPAPAPRAAARTTAPRQTQQTTQQQTTQQQTTQQLPEQPTQQTTQQLPEQTTQQTTQQLPEQLTQQTTQQPTEQTTQQTTQQLPPEKPLFPAPFNMLPADGYHLDTEQAKQTKNIVFSWSAVDGANAYILTILKETASHPERIFQTEISDNTNKYSFDNFRLLSDNGAYIWQLEAISYNSDDIIDKRGRTGESSFIVDIPRPGRVRVKEMGILYGTE